MNRLKNVFSKGASKAENIFKKGVGVSENIFKKGTQVAQDVKQFAKEQAPEIASAISKQSGEASQILAKGAKIANKIGSSPALQTLPFGSQVAGLAKTVGGGLSAGSKLSGQISNVSDLSTYKKNKDGSVGVGRTIENLADAKRRIDMMRGSEPQFVG